MKKNEIKQRIKFDHYLNYESKFFLESNRYFDFSCYSKSSYLAKEFAKENRDLFEALVNREIDNNIHKIIDSEKAIKQKLKKIHTVKINTNTERESFYNYHFNNNSTYSISCYKSHNIFYGYVVLCKFIYISFSIDLYVYFKTKNINDILSNHSSLEVFKGTSENNLNSLNNCIKKYLTSELIVGDILNKKTELYESLLFHFFPLTIKLDKLRNKNRPLYDKLNDYNLLNLPNKIKKEIYPLFNLEKEIKILQDGVLKYNNELMSNKSDQK